MGVHSPHFFHSLRFLQEIPEKMNISGVIEDRRSVRRFRSIDVENEKISEIVKAAKWAPSAGNLQARDLILIKEPKTREQLAKAAFSQMFILEAPLVFIVCANSKKSSQVYGSQGELYSIQDATASIQNMLLALHSLGLGCCWIGAFDSGRVREILNIPAKIMPIALITVVYPGE